MPDEPMRFGPIVIRPAERTISVGGRPVDVGARAFDVLLALAARRDRLVTRDELLDLVWPGVIVEEHNVTAQVSTLRRLLGPHVIATVPGRGYRFVAAVDEVPPRDPDATATQCHNLPAMRTRFVGRDAEKAEIGRLLAHNRLLTLTGIGGSGKTRLDERDEGDAARTRHAEYFLRLAETAAPELVGPRQSQWMEVLGLEHENLVAAMSHCLDARASADPSWALRLAAATGRYWLFNEIELGCRLSLAALQRHRGGGHDAARFDTLRGLAGMYMHRGQGAAGLPHAREALALARQAGNAQWQAMAYNVMGTCLSRASEDAAALEHYERARDLAQSSGDVATLSAAVNNIANVDFAHGRLDEAQRGFSQALRLAREARNLRSSLIYLNNLIRTTVASKRFADAHAHATEAERLLRDVGEDALKLELLEVAAALASGRGQHAIAARWWGFACPRFLDEGYRRPTEDEAALRRSLSASRDALGHEAFERNQTTGRTLDIASAMRELRAWLEAAARPGDGSRPARARPRPEPGNRV